MFVLVCVCVINDSDSVYFTLHACYFTLCHINYDKRLEFFRRWLAIFISVIVAEFGTDSFVLRNNLNFLLVRIFIDII